MRAFASCAWICADQDGDGGAVRRERFERVVHLGAQAGVRYSLREPHAYIDSNVVGTLNVLEGCRHNGVGHLVYASTSSVYGASTRLPFSVHEPASHPLSLYAATKRATELMAHSYAALFQVAGHGAALLHGLWAMGPARHGVVPIRARDSRRQADRGVQLRPSPARLHLRGRHRRGRACG